MTNAALNTLQKPSAFQVEPLLLKAFKEAEKEHKKLQKVFSMMGWGNLPDILKMEIKDDVTAMVEELEGQYSTCDPFILKRRESVSYWVKNFQHGVCSLKMAVDALKVTKL